MLTSVLLNVTQVGAEWVLWILVALSVVSVSLIVERCIYFYVRRVDSDALGTELERMLQAGDVRSAFDLVKGSESIECAVVAAGLPALRRGATACGEALLAGYDWQQRPVHRAVGHGAWHREGGARFSGGGERPGRSERRDGGRLRGVGGDRRGAVRRHSGGRRIQPAAAARAEHDGER
jgi:hypothetical protein